MTLPVLGIDIAKAKFDVALLIHGKFKTKVFKNTAKGFATLSTWLSHHGIDRVHACMEATGRYGEALATCLAEAGHIVSVVNPAQIKGYAQSELTRTKTDQADAELIARFCQTLRPAPWQPVPAAIRTLQGLVRRLQALLDMRLQETNRLDLACEPVTASINTVLVTLNQEIDAVRRSIRDHIDQHPLLRKQRELLASIPASGRQPLLKSWPSSATPPTFRKPNSSQRLSASTRDSIAQVPRYGAEHDCPKPVIQICGKPCIRPPSSPCANSCISSMVC